MSVGMEGIPAGIVGAPPDQQARTLDEILDEAWSIITSDRLLDTGEMESLSRFFRACQEFGMAQQQAQAGTGALPAEPGATGPDNRQQDYGEGRGAPVNLE